MASLYSRVLCDSFIAVLIYLSDSWLVLKILDKLYLQHSALDGVHLSFLHTWEFRSCLGGSAARSWYVVSATQSSKSISPRNVGADHARSQDLLYANVVTL